MDPFTLALATFGVQKLRGKSTKRALRDAALVGGASYGFSKAAGAGFIPGVQQGVGIGKIGTGEAFSGIQGLLGTEGLTEEAARKELGKGATKAEIAKAMRGTGIRGLGTGEKIFAGTTLLSLLEGEEPEVKPPFTEEDYTKAYNEQVAKLGDGFAPFRGAQPSVSESFAPSTIYAAKGGLAEIKRFKEGGVNFLPSKLDHDEKDFNNYVRAQGYVEDGSGAGDKDEDTMLAQLADGEFVSRADAVLGAGILSGANPKNFKVMREKGAEFFYDQQKKLKRVYDLLNESKTN